MAVLNCIVVTPETTALEEETEFVALPLYDGEIGIAPGHSPMIGRLGYGEMRLRLGSETVVYYVDGGFVQVADGIVSVLTNRAVPAEELEVDVTREQLESARALTANTPERMAVRDRQVLQARAMLRVASRQSAGHG